MTWLNLVSLFLVAVIFSYFQAVSEHMRNKDLANLSGYFQVSQAFVNNGQQSETDSSALRKLTAKSGLGWLLLAVQRGFILPNKSRE